MTNKQKDDTWIWVIVQDPSGNEQFLGQHDDEKDVSFIPAFHEKDIAQQAVGKLITEKGTKYEAQAEIDDTNAVWILGCTSELTH